MCGGPPEENIVVLKKGNLGNEDFVLRIWVTGYGDCIEDFVFSPNSKSNYVNIGTPATIGDMSMYNMNNPDVGGSDCDWALEKDGKFYTSESLNSCLREEFSGDPFEGFERLGTLGIEDFGEA